jgi:hypothetical protein
MASQGGKLQFAFQHTPARRHKIGNSGAPPGQHYFGPLALDGVRRLNGICGTRGTNARLPGSRTGNYTEETDSERRLFAIATGPTEITRTAEMPAFAGHP